MLLIKLDPSFSGDKNFGDPLTHPEITIITNKFVQDMEPFVRRAIDKILSPTSLAFFIDTNAPIPFVDLEIYFYSPFRRRLSIIYRKKVIAAALVNSAMVDTLAGKVCINHVQEEVI